MSLVIQDLVASAEKKKILDHFSLTVHEGEIHAIMGPNGTGKSTLSKVILGDPHYLVESGDILFLGESLLRLTTDERARKGIFLAYQNPISIEGVRNSEFLKTALQEKTGERVNLYTFLKQLEMTMDQLEMDPAMLHRSINQDFSGGERKKNEILQMQLLEPSLVILDELDSGLDVDSLRIVCQKIQEYLTLHPKTSVLIITHYPRILEYLYPDYVHIMMNGKIQRTGNMELAKEIEKDGYAGINDIRKKDVHE